MSGPGPTRVELEALRDRINRLFDEWTSLDPRAASNAWTPPGDVVERDGDYRIDVDLPGIDPNAVELEVDGRHLVVRGRRDYPATGGAIVHRIERHYGPFARTFDLPERLDDARTGWQYREGVLSIRLAFE